MASDLNQRKSSLLFSASIIVNEEPTTAMTVPLNDLPFAVQTLIDYLRRNAVTKLVIGEIKNNPWSDYNRDMSRQFNVLYPDLKKHYNHDKRTVTDEYMAKQSIKELGACVYADDEVEMICNEIKNSINIKSVFFRGIENSEASLKHLTAAIIGNSSIEKIYFQVCDELFVSAIKKIAEERLLEVVFFGETVNNAENLPERETGFLSNIGCWQVIDGFIAVVGLFTLALAFIAFEAASLNPLGIIVGVVGCGLLGGGFSHFFSQPESPDENDFIPNEVSQYTL